ncbi:hypothetical protein GA0115254_11122 [Streptomyces sp. Ncost-T10-10d]|nr:hypothetical protein GA0115254_11122 [Streptomyces sp. Ncost-T10-10d]
MGEAGPESVPNGADPLRGSADPGSASAQAPLTQTAPDEESEAEQGAFLGKKPQVSGLTLCAPGRIRTCDTRFRSEVAPDLRNTDFGACWLWPPQTAAVPRESPPDLARLWHSAASRCSPSVASVAAISVGDQIGGGLSMLIKSPSHLISGVSGVLAYRDTASAARSIPSPQQRRAHALLTGIRQDQRRLDGDITPVVPDMHHQRIRALTLIHFRAGKPQPLQGDAESASGLSHEGLYPYIHPPSMSPR